MPGLWASFRVFPMGVLGIIYSFDTRLSLNYGYLCNDSQATHHRSTAFDGYRGPESCLPTPKAAGNLIPNPSPRVSIFFFTPYWFLVLYAFPLCSVVSSTSHAHKHIDAQTPLNAYMCILSSLSTRRNMLDGRSDDSAQGLVTPVEMKIGEHMKTIKLPVK